jgi:hypothetical protein
VVPGSGHPQMTPVASQSSRDRRRYTPWITVAPGDTMRVWDEDVKLIEHYMKIQHTPIEWEANKDELRVTAEGQ